MNYLREYNRSTRERNQRAVAKQQDVLCVTGKRKTDGPAAIECHGSPSCGRWVTHFFSRRTTERDSIAVMYRCSICRTQRQWGLEVR